MFAKVLGVALIAGIVLAGGGDDRISCRDEDGNFVDWYYLYKLPASYSPLRESHELKYLYLSPNTIDQGWLLSQHKVNETASFPGRTLSPIQGKADVAIIAYNDETPEGQVSSVLGHTKGVLAGDSRTGFWLIHSVPKYPNVNHYEYPETGSHYGQSFLCLSLNASQINLVAKQLRYNEPNVYSSQIPDTLTQLYPNLVLVAEEIWHRDPPYWNFETLETIGGTKFGSFAKGSKFQKELYEDWVAPMLGADLMVESWRNGAGKLSSNCTREHSVWNIVSINVNSIDVKFKSSLDHSKWCVSKEISTQWICVGDINRMEHQTIRGGGTVCQANKKIAAAYRNIISDVEQCSHF